MEGEMNPIKEAFLKASVVEQEEFCIDNCTVLCRISRNVCSDVWCNQVLMAWKGKLIEDYQIKKSNANAKV